jgi:hypothetical protein
VSRVLPFNTLRVLDGAVYVCGGGLVTLLAMEEDLP